MRAQDVGGHAGRLIQGHPGATHLARSVRVTSGDDRQLIGARKGDRPVVVGTERDPRIQSFDRVDEAGIGDPLDCAASQAGSTEAIKWVGDGHEAALVADAPDRFLGSQSARDGRGEEKANHLTFGGHDFLADDDGESGVAIWPARDDGGRLATSVDGVVIGDAQCGQSGANGTDKQ